MGTQTNQTMPTHHDKPARKQVQRSITIRKRTETHADRHSMKALRRSVQCERTAQGASARDHADQTMRPSKTGDGRLKRTPTVSIVLTLIYVCRKHQPAPYPDPHGSMHSPHSPPLESKIKRERSAIHAQDQMTTQVSKMNMTKMPAVLHRGGKAENTRQTHNMRIALTQTAPPGAPPSRRIRNKRYVY